MTESQGWRRVDYDTAWAPFRRKFEFAADYYERDKPAIHLPPGTLVLDLSPLFAVQGARLGAGTDAINASALRAFVWLTDEDDELLALDWNHSAFRYSPAAFTLVCGIEQGAWGSLLGVRLAGSGLPQRRLLRPHDP